MVRVFAVQGRSSSRAVWRWRSLTWCWWSRAAAGGENRGVRCRGCADGVRGSGGSSLRDSSGRGWRTTMRGLSDSWTVGESSSQFGPSGEEEAQSVAGVEGVVGEQSEVFEDVGARVVGFVGDEDGSWRACPFNQSARPALRARGTAPSPPAPARLPAAAGARSGPLPRSARWGSSRAGGSASTSPSDCVLGSSVNTWRRQAQGWQDAPSPIGFWLLPGNGVSSPRRCAADSPIQPSRRTTNGGGTWTVFALSPK